MIYKKSPKQQKAVKKIFKSDKLNFALNGNWINHLHWHIYPRYRVDPDFGQPSSLQWKNEDMSKSFKSKVKLTKKILTKKQIQTLQENLRIFFTD